jgi:hypothetical protein
MFISEYKAHIISIVKSENYFSNNPSIVYKISLIFQLFNHIYVYAYYQILMILN